MADEDNPDPDERISYFVVKCGSLESLQKCIQTCKWAFRKRSKPPQPKDLLEKAHSNGKVLLIFSVNNQHGWHGYCQSLYSNNMIAGAGQLETAQLYNNESESNISDLDEEWCYFCVKWIKHFQSLSSYGCLPLDRTSHLFLLDNSPVNQARNWQQMSQEVGQQLCCLLDHHFTALNDKKQAAERQKLEAIIAKESFFKAEENSVEFCADISTGWHNIIEKVENDLGKVILACPFGSQRYNCNVPDSDSDILVIYQAKTIEMLGLDPPQQTIKNSHCAKMDYTVLELQRYCELLIAGDPRYIETLFIEEESILAFASESWRRICKKRHLLLSQDCLDKYLREAKGTKGLKLFQRWKNEMKDDKVPQKINKLAYIILRLLQAGRDIATNQCIKVYRQDDSKERQELLDARLGHFDVATLTSLFEKYIEEIEQSKGGVSFNDVKVAKQVVQDWLVEARVQDLRVLRPSDSEVKIPDLEVAGPSDYL